MPSEEGRPLGCVAEGFPVVPLQSGDLVGDGG